MSTALEGDPPASRPRAHVPGYIYTAAGGVTRARKERLFMKGVDSRWPARKRSRARATT
jgi:hypothetical protein